MSSKDLRLLVTGATGELGRLVVARLAEAHDPARVVALVRDPSRAQGLAALGAEIRVANYDDPAALNAAFAGVDRALLISSSEVGRRVPQHRNVIDAAKAVNVSFLAYTSLLRADASPLALAAEHLATERAIEASGLPFALLRNGWYTENKTVSAPAALDHGAVLGCAGTGRFATASRQDYAEAAAAVLLADDAPAGRTFELAGDDAFTMAEFASEIGRLSGKPVIYRDLPEAEFRAALEAAGLPAPFAALLADSDAGASKGGLYSERTDLSRLIGRPTTPWRRTLADAIAA
ncbi:SDR family oxidoreductase [Chelatococcus sambhunathii]|uniref:SDR family oxidoreductase n=1 Tax=Chelatococcus sambhunathii TaxID=363953 RepID=A0ABU1DBY7_9HYPH|nr:SDR family oxidoreductase [Chelatococcus sambhunathii]MDR4305586.1 SDR family oxidoreductase [Chelatococcus sambhunathii]